MSNTLNTINISSTPNEYNMQSISNGIIILLCLLFAIVFMIYKTYQTKLTPKTFLINIYLYIIVCLLFVAFIGNYTQHLKIINDKHIFRFIILYVILAFSGIFMIFKNDFFVNHIGFLLLALALSLIMGTHFRYSKNVSQAATITTIIMLVLTAIVFSVNEDTLIRMTKWLPTLTWILLFVIIAEISYMLLFDYNPTFNKVMSVLVVTLFSFFILSDTSRILMKAKNLPCNTHSCINYPKESTSLILDFMNIFSRLTHR